ncbi:MAG TPA: outer membrane beta-barrel protein [Terracidiphilus sp.]|jgi:opacity protein-like surface antigen|nr:outer membrane beta-barrel protein [Terracidiphilus sp.]
MSTNKGLNLVFIFLGAIALCVSAQAQTSVAVSVYGAFSGTTTGNNVQESPSNSAGGLIELRHISNPILGYEATYSYNRANTSYRCTGTSCPVLSPATVSANAHELTLDWVPSVHLANLRPFGVLGVGLLLNQPSGGQNNTSTSIKPVYVYGAGLDWGLLPHLGLRFQYRGNLYKSPDLSKLYTSTDQFRHTSEPMIGAYFSF